MGPFHASNITLLVPKPSEVEHDGLEDSILGGMFETINKMRRMPWSQVEELMNEWRIVLAMGEWLESVSLTRTSRRHI
jgi:hypothetical protein